MEGYWVVAVVAVVGIVFTLMMFRRSRPKPSGRGQSGGGSGTTDEPDIKI